MGACIVKGISKTLIQFEIPDRKKGGYLNLSLKRAIKHPDGA